ncbi:MAG TPA: protein translocase subunit SecD [Solirubrobacteraceae bacterium]|nr:protein translocase subunit SecD [Solirubrobacteraceae bacterium]
MSDRQRHGFVLLLVAGLLAASVFVITTQRTILGLDLRGGVQLVYQGQPTPQTPVVTQAALSRAVDIMRSRVDQLGVSEPEISTYGSNEISVGLPDVHDIARAEREVGQTAELYFYDWEANVLTPNGRTVASQLIAQDPTAIELSTGGSAGQPGVPGAGGLPLYQAVALASRQPPAPLSKHLSRDGPLYYMFGAPGSAACAAAAKADGTPLVAGQHCLLSGPDPTISELDQGLPPGVTPSEGQVLKVPQGIVVLQAANPSSSVTIKPTSPQAQFFVLRDDVALTGKEITNPIASTDASGAPDVQFGFTPAGQAAFQRVTAQIAHRGADVSIGGQTLNQHFAVALDNQLITVPQIDFHQYPDGIIGGGGADITGGFTSQSASDLANELRLGALPIQLKLISESQVSATLGSQALHQGLVAGAAGLLVVALFLILYYRILGLIAVAALAVYAVYFYALIKLIPVTLTLAGIAGLILTIGVAADANIVIFERVKEEIRAGRTIRAGIAAGYRKGLTAIIDANVVTIMTAFILFVLATSDVQGFAFTLGIGVIVSLFTAVLATQAILMTMGDSRTIARPSALGAGKPRRQWRFDFMGASKYFFTMSGVILLVGALAIGGRGLNLGIDFTSGTRITATLSRPATAAQVSATVTHAGASNPTVQRLGSRGEQFQIAFKAGPQASSSVRQALYSRYGLRSFNSSSIGPTFGATIAHAAVIAIIASLLVISLYVTLRFDWKFAVPVLIALMHDILITSGVYALTGRVVTVDTVAALLTILGYSLYDTIIVFDRIRENVPRMPRAAFSQIVNRSMSEVLTRSLATTSCTLLPIVALLLFGGSTLRDFAFALLIGVASGAYSSIFIASPVLTHWKEREPVYRHRRARILADLGTVPAYAAAGSDVDPSRGRVRRRPVRLADVEETVSAAEFEQMKRDLDIEPAPARRTSTLAKRLAHTAEPDGDPPAPARRARASRATRAPGPRPGPSRSSATAGGAPGGSPLSATPARTAAGEGPRGEPAGGQGPPAGAPRGEDQQPGSAQSSGAQPGSAQPGGVQPWSARAADQSPPATAVAPGAAQGDEAPARDASASEAGGGPGADASGSDGFRHAPDQPENDAVARPQRPAGAGGRRPRGRRHGRRR